ncbi:MAG: OmpA family protein [Deltaproteobacteria bacterium]|nr:OmpA family protein [Deltaproteobacteria bacterium]
MTKRLIFTTLLALLVSLSVTAQAKNGPLSITITQKDIDLDNRTIHFKINRAISVAEIKVTDLDGETLSEQLTTFSGQQAGTPLEISWPEIIGDEQNFKIELKVTDVDDFWVGFQIVHFYGDIPHEEVIFESGKWDIRPTEAPKLDEVIPKIIAMLQKFQKSSSQMTYNLYIAGHTDTVGNTADNRTLSMKRAQEIANYLMQKGLKKQKISIFVRGFGEELPAVNTADNTPEEKNRRADYIISNFPPSMPGPGSWKPVQKK